MTLNILQHGMRYAFNLAIQIFPSHLFIFIYFYIIENSVAKMKYKNMLMLKMGAEKKKKNILWSSNNNNQHTTYNNITRETLEEFSYMI